MHKVAPQIEQAIEIPLLHIADATAEVLVEKDIKTVGLLGTAFTITCSTMVHMKSAQWPL